MTVGEPADKKTPGSKPMFLPLRKLDVATGEALYARLRSRSAVDTHRNILSEAKTFLAWCVGRKRWMPSNPFEGIKGTGRRNKGKAQPRIDEARKWTAAALALG